jgi:hypothetical protein
MWLVSVFIARLMAEELASCMPEDGKAIALVLDDNYYGHERGKECFESERLGIPCTLFSVAEQLLDANRKMGCLWQGTVAYRRPYDV